MLGSMPPPLPLLVVFPLLPLPTSQLICEARMAMAVGGVITVAPPEPPLLSLPPPPETLPPLGLPLVVLEVPSAPVPSAPVPPPTTVAAQPRRKEGEAEREDDPGGGVHGDGGLITDCARAGLAVGAGENEAFEAVCQERGVRAGTGCVSRRRFRA